MKILSKSVTPVDDYTFTLSDHLKRVVETEFRETDEIRRHSLESLREWAENNHRICKMRLDSKFLLKFLRCRKFSLPMAKESIERYLILRFYSQEGMPLFHNLDYKLPIMNELLDLGYIFALPKRDHLGRRIIFYRPGVFNPSVHANHEMLKVHAIVYESLMEDEENQINGFVHVVDSTGIGLNYLTLFTPHEAYRIGKNLEKLLPMRHKEIHGLKVHPSVKFAVDFALAKMSEKMKNRVLLHRNVEDVTTVVEKSLLPSEYGGDIPMSDMIEAFRLELEAKRELLLKHDEMRVNLDSYPRSIREGSVRSLKKSIEEVDDTPNDKDHFGPQGSFRKLEID